MKEKYKDFDAVKMMRQIRDSISDETQNMSFEEFKLYVKNKLEGHDKISLIGKK